MAYKKRKNANGEGTIYKCSSGRHKGKWIGQLVIGNDPSTGKVKRKSVYGFSRGEVKEKLDDLKRELNMGIDLYSQSYLTFGDWLITYMYDYKKLEIRLSTWENYMTNINTHILPTIGTVALADLKTDDIQKLLNKMNKEGSSSSTTRRVAHIMNSAIKQAMKNRLISWNPVDAAVLPKMKIKEKRAMTMEEMDKFINILQEDRWGAAFLTLLGTGLRRGELLGQREQDINLDEGYTEIKQALAITKEKGLILDEPKTKSSKGKIPLPEIVVNALRKHLTRQKQLEKWFADKYNNEHKLLFCTDYGTPINPRNFSRKFNQLRKKAGIPKEITLHGLRHTFATRLLELGENQRIIQELLRHSKGDTTEIYTHVSMDVKKAAAEKINQLLKKSLK
ncbi:MAG: hypothetical protein VR72_02810 [Clostridiaceae bacterium BRH_c20a]|nr:MAG: hypothetical protein VR72_02810 [Clostridiaceae bacterium BRH_c20a]